ncbi:ArsR/SmtB family transcription factor [Streptomyces sp. NPDC058001]|uniref:ArsR/SmtB family transcription factor n=1 Tax=Streptomyces sp. NPDC058001 TaxID=3346300 RepID=UPI0036E2A51A
MPEAADRPEEPSVPASVRALDARTLRGLAHPLRMAMLSTLRHDGPATASQLAARLGESSGATSYHLRQLAAHGFVEDDPEHGKGRERWWRATHTGTTFGEGLLRHDDPHVRGAANLFLHEVASMHAHETSNWLGTRDSWSEEWQRSSDLSDFTLRLTPERARELNDRVHELINSYREFADESGAGADEAAQTRILLHAFPRSRD